MESELSSKNKTYYQLQNSWQWSIQQGQLVLFSPLQTKAFKIQHKSSHAISHLLNLLKEGMPEEEIYISSLDLGLDHLLVDSLLKKLTNENVLLKTSALRSFSEEDNLYNRQIRFFNLFEDSTRTGEDLNLQLQNKRVLITGLGGYGTWLTLFCSRIGIKSIVGIDFDKVELSNLNRQILYTLSDIGRLKIEACKDAISLVNPEIEFKGVDLQIQRYQDILPYLEGVDLVFNTFVFNSLDNSLNSYGGQVALACIKKQIPCLNLRGNWIGPLYVPTKSPCYFCALESIKSNRKAPDKELNMGKRVETGSFAPFIASTVSHAVWEAANFLCDLPYSLTKDNILILNRFGNRIYDLFPIYIAENCICQLKTL